MSLSGDLCLFEITSRRIPTKFRKFTTLVLLLSTMAMSAYAQTVSWTDSFLQGQKPTIEQCTNWSLFLDQLGQKNFSTVTMSGTADNVGLTITDPKAATALATLLYSRTPGSVTSDGHTWTVDNSCGTSVCGGGYGTFLTVDRTASSCDCSDTYSVRPQINGYQWGGLHTTSACNSANQTISIVFNSGVSITAQGSTTLCAGGSVELTANAQICGSTYSYLWSTGETTRSITVSKAGNYSVTVSSQEGCSGVSTPTAVTVSAASVRAGEDQIFCDAPVQLNATVNSGGSSSGSVASMCLFDAEGGTGNCTFVEDLCTEGAEFFNDHVFASSVRASDPSQLTFLLYYSPFTEISTFSFSLNGQAIGTFQDNDPTGTCFPESFGQYPRQITFNKSQFIQYWNNTSENTLAVQVVGDGMGVYLGGISAQVISTDEFYSWSPSAGLSDATIRNPLASPEATTIYTVTYTNANGCTTTDQVEVKANCNTAPIAVCKPLTVSVDANCEALVEAGDFDAGSSSTNGSELKFSVSPAGPYPMGETQVTFTVTDANGKSSSCSTTVTVKDTTPPVIVAPADVVATNDAGACSATIVLQAPVATDNCGINTISSDQDDNIFPVGEHLVTWTVADIHGNIQTAVQKVIVVNSDPVISAVTPSVSPVETNKPVSLGIVYSDDNIKSATIAWGDLSAPEVIASPEARFSVTHSYANPGTYAVTVTLTDLCDASVSYVYESITVFEKRVGSVEGSGWFYSKAGYYLKDRRAAGKAHFSFEAEYTSASSVPVGAASFKFKAGKLDFRSREFELLRVDGASAFLTGSGKLNEKAGYKILLAMFDDQAKGNETFSTQGKGKGDKKADRIRVKIWDPSGAVVYDTQSGSADDAVATTEIGGGSIEVNNDHSTFQDTIEDFIDNYFGEEATSVYPNPFVDYIQVQFNATSREKIKIQVMDLSGKVHYAAQFEVSDDGSYSLEIPEGKPGIYILKIEQGSRVEFFPLLRQ
ncbi:MAG: HYR domain-containing protein [Chryseosolibacter sp.]